MPSPKKILWPMVAAVAIAGGSYFGTLTLHHSSALAETPAETARPTPAPQSENVVPAEDLSRAFRTVHNALKDAVVNIRITKKMAMPRRMIIPHDFQLPPGFGPQDLNPNDNGNDEQQIEGTGSGVIVSPDGYVLTNNHVVEDATEIIVRLDDGREIKAKTVGTDPKTDLAVIKIDADHLTYAKFGDSDATEVGDWVLAFGSPLNFEQTMTQGIISAKHRQIDIIAEHNQTLAGLTYEDFLQTDAAINPGNSGGPLVNLRGEVIGINSAIASNTGFYNGIGFSIPSNEARYIMDSLIKNGKVIRGYLQVQIEDVNHPAPRDKNLVESIKSGGFSGKGILVGSVGPEGPAAKGGVQAGDVITALNGKPVDGVNQLRNQIARTAPGTNISLTIWRDGKTTELKFPVGTQPASIASADNDDNGAPVAADVNDFGVRVRGVDASTAKKYHLGASKGVVITEVDPRGEAAQAGIDTGDVITRVNHTAVNSPEEFNDAISKAKKGETLRLSVRSADGMERLVLIDRSK